jgi:hypothetical protein
MTTSTNTIRRLTTILGLVGVALAIVAPGAVAGHQDLGTKAALQQIQGVHPTKGAGTVGIGRERSAEETPDVLERYLRNNPRQDRPGDRAGTRGVGEQTIAVDTSDAVSRYLRSKSASNRTGIGRPETSKPAIHVPVASPAAFDWRDAGIGAGSALALVLIALGGMVILLRRKPSGTRMLTS